jgi:hypothetical protein
MTARNGHQWPRARSPVIALDSVMRTALPPIDWLVEGVLANGDRAVFYAEYGAFKTWSLLDLGMHIAAAQPWLKTFAVPKSRTVLYLDEEMNRRELWRRMQRLGMTLGVGDVPSCVPFGALSHHGVRLNEEGAKRFLGQLQRWGAVPEVLIIDALRRVLVGDESQARDVSEFWRALEVLRDTGMTVLVAHHMRKTSRSGNEARQRASGSTDILAGADTAYAIHRVPPDTIKVECVKARSIPEPPPFGVRICDDGPDSPVEMRHVGDIDQAGKLGKAERMALDFLVKQPPPVRTGDLIRHLRAGGVAVRTAERVLPKLVRLELARSVGRGMWELVGVTHA